MYNIKAVEVVTVGGVTSYCAFKPRSRAKVSIVSLRLDAPSQARSIFVIGEKSRVR